MSCHNMWLWRCSGWVGVSSNQSATGETEKKRDREPLQSETESKTSNRRRRRCWKKEREWRGKKMGEIKAGGKVEGGGGEQVKAGLVQVGFRQSVRYFRRAEGGRGGRGREKGMDGGRRR